jgi:hypothetical protein
MTVGLVLIRDLIRTGGASGPISVQSGGRANVSPTVAHAPGTRRGTACSQQRKTDAISANGSQSARDRLNVLMKTRTPSSKPSTMPHHNMVGTCWLDPRETFDARADVDFTYLQMRYGPMEIPRSPLHNANRQCWRQVS